LPREAAVKLAGTWYVAMDAALQQVGAPAT
jgi:hypothetical protein